jgi:hypothetical protein
VSFGPPEGVTGLAQDTRKYAIANETNPLRILKFNVAMVVNF